MKRIVLASAAVLIMIFLIACDDDKKITEPTDNPNTFTADVSGSLNFVFDATAISYEVTETGDNAKLIEITGTISNQDNEYTIAIKLTKLGDDKEFTTDNGSMRVSFVAYDKKTAESTYYINKISGEASFEILGDTIALGTFSFSAKTENLEKEISVSNGKIDWDQSRF